MKLTPDEAIDFIKTPKNKKNIEACRRQESQLRVFTEELDKDELDSEFYWNSLVDKMRARATKKFDRVFQFARYPLPVGQLCDSILSDYYKVFDGKNRHFHVDGDRDLTLVNRWIEQNGLDKWIEDHARQVFKNRPCSFVVVDKDTYGQPYLVFVDADRIVDAQFKNSTGELEYIVFLHSIYTDESKTTIKRYAVYDDETYFVFEKPDNSDTYKKVSDFKHNIGYTPAVAFVPRPANDKNYFKRRVAFSSALSKLEDWTIFDIFRNYVDHYAPFPVTEAPKKKCPNPECEDGSIQTEEIDPRFPESERHVRVQCPTCLGKAEDNSLIYPGTHIGITVSRDKADNDGSGIFRMIFPETDKMKYVPEKLDDLEVEIRHKTVGLNYMQSTNEAINELQVKGSFSSMESVLLRTKEELDSLYKWIVKTVARSYYKDVNVKVDANFGTEFYLVTEDDLQIRYKAAKEMGLPQEEQLMIYSQLIDTKYKGNPNKVQRQKMLLQLQPLPLYDTKEVIEMKEKGLVDPATLSMKINFLSFVSLFELENGPITQFGLGLEIDKRIEIIKTELEKYNAEQMAKIPAPPAAKPEVQL